VVAVGWSAGSDSEWQWHLLGYMQVCSRSRHNHASTPPLSFLQAGCPSCRPTNSVKALKALSPATKGLLNGCVGVCVLSSGLLKTQIKAVYNHLVVAYACNK